MGQSTEESEPSSTTSILSTSASEGTMSATDGTTEGTTTAASIVSEVVQSVKTAVDSAIAWAETKVDSLSAEQNSTGPYTSPATCMPSDLDVIASGILPAMPTARQYDGVVEDERKEAESTEKTTGTDDEEGKKNGEK
ncbi:hypothetical protein G6011_08321 [Alternaria panax]|uniref:Uncharacterized protein n=1 Tax=Alternaria panax TaxID=48097 RepID=A0AAD4FJS0_9PLEO|nr:hypothetical protein G6011_08321 [Alternaria panax]